MALLAYNSIVTTPATSKDLTVLATVTAELNSPVGHNALISVFIQQASSKAAELSRREFAAETMTDSFRADYCGSTVLQLARRPIKSVTSVVEDGVTLAGTDYESIAANGWLQRIDASGNPQSWGDKTVVVYVAGYALLTEESHALERIVIDEVKRNYYARSRDPLLKSIDVDGVARLDYWVDRSGSGGGTGQIDPMLAALSQQGFVDAVV